MDLADNPNASASTKDINCTVRPTVSAGTFSIESILKSGGFRHVPAPPPCPPAAYQSFAALPQQHGFGDHNVKKEELDDDISEAGPGMMGGGISPIPGSSLTSDTANCHDDSGQLFVKHCLLISLSATLLDVPFN